MTTCLLLFVAWMFAAALLDLMAGMFAAMERFASNEDDET